MKNSVCSYRFPNNDPLQSKYVWLGQHSPQAFPEQIEQVLSVTFGDPQLKQNIFSLEDRIGCLQHSYFKFLCVFYFGWDKILFALVFYFRIMWEAVSD